VVRMEVGVEWRPRCGCAAKDFCPAGHLPPLFPSFPSTIFLFILITAPRGQIGELLATWSGCLATYLGRLATPWLPIKGLQRGASSFIPQAHKQSLYTTLCFLPPVQLTLTPRVLGTFCCVLFLQVLCMMKKLLGGVKRAFSSGLSSRGSNPHSNDSRSQDSPRSSSFMPSPHRTTGSSHYLAHDDVPEARNSDDISIHTTEEMEKYESLHHQEFAHTCIYDVNLLERVDLDEELPTILRTIGWGKLYDEPRQGSRLLTLEFLTTFEIVEKGKSCS
jgi:hypothetical protein